MFSYVGRDYQAVKIVIEVDDNALTTSLWLSGSRIIVLATSQNGIKQEGVCEHRLFESTVYCQL